LDLTGVLVGSESNGGLAREEEVDGVKDILVVVSANKSQSVAHKCRWRWLCCHG
jgi:hypothetical protein